jgi:hypothetical protein
MGYHRVIWGHNARRRACGSSSRTRSSSKSEAVNVDASGARARGAPQTATLCSNPPGSPPCDRSTEGSRAAAGGTGLVAEEAQVGPRAAEPELDVLPREVHLPEADRQPFHRRRQVRRHVAAEGELRLEGQRAREEPAGLRRQRRLRRHRRVGAAAHTAHSEAMRVLRAAARPHLLRCGAPPRRLRRPLDPRELLLEQPPHLARNAW